VASMLEEWRLMCKEAYHLHPSLIPLIDEERVRAVGVRLPSTTTVVADLLAAVRWQAVIA